jgi:riboflavin synthase
MFTGIVTSIGTVRAVEKRGDTHITIAAPFDIAGLSIGASIACSGCCLTVAGRDPAQSAFSVTASAETLAHTNLSSWRPGDRINLERPLRVGDELGGHIVSGHVDGVAELLDATPEGESLRLMFRAPVDLARFIAPKGSVALDGVSLTVNEVDGARFGVNIIPHTQSVTTLGRLAEAGPGVLLNLEIDPLARYVARLAQS